MKVSIVDLRQYAVDRNEDSLVCNAIMKLMGAVEGMTPGYWGSLPWSADWSRSWVTAAGWRIEDAKRSRDLLLDTSNTLMQVLADYTGADQEGAADLNSIDVATQERLRIYLDADTVEDNHHTGRYRPGGGHRFAVPTDKPRPLLSGPLANPELTAGGPHADAPLFDGPAPDGESEEPLYLAMKAHGQFLAFLENEVVAVDKNASKFFSDYLLPAYHTRPKKIELYGDEVLAGANAYQQMVNHLGVQNDKLGNLWTGDAGSAFGAHAFKVKNYLQACADQAKLLGGEEAGAKKAASIVRELRSKYAEIIGRYAPTLKEQWLRMTTPSDQVFNIFLSVITLEWRDAADRLMKLVNGMTGELGDMRTKTQELALSLIKVEGVPDFDSPTRQPRHIPVDQSPAADDWRHRNEWDDRKSG